MGTSFQVESDLQGRILHNAAALVGFTFVAVILRWFVAQRNALNELTRHQRDELLKEVELAAEVQRLFLPRNDPETAGFEIAGFEGKKVNSYGQTECEWGWANI
jgi:hypothetical protein